MNTNQNTATLLVEQLIKTAQELDNLEDSLKFRLDANEEEADRILNKGIKNFQLIYKEIGTQLNALGGFQLMQQAIYKVPNNKGAHSVINDAWDGIGNWVM